MSVKRKRDPTFVTSEKEALIQLVGQHFQVLESKKTDAVSTKQKIENWKKISHEFNAISSIHPRDWMVLKNCWENLKKRAKQEQTLRNQEFLKTGGGPPKKSNNDPIIEKVLALIHKRVIGYLNSNDVDGYNVLTSGGNTELVETRHPEVSLCLTDANISESGDQMQVNVVEDEPAATTITADWSQYNATMLRDEINPILARSPSPSATSTPLRDHAAPVAVATVTTLPALTTTSRRRPTVRRTRESSLNTERVNLLLKTDLRAEEEHEVEIAIRKEILEQEKLKTRQEQIKLQILEIQLNNL